MSASLLNSKERRFHFCPHDITTDVRNEGFAPNFVPTLPISIDYHVSIANQFEQTSIRLATDLKDCIFTNLDNRDSKRVGDIMLNAEVVSSG